MRTHESPPAELPEQRSTPTAVPPAYQAALQLALQGQHAQAAVAYRRLDDSGDARLQALVHNDLAVLATVAGHEAEAAGQFAAALACDPTCAVATENQETLACYDARRENLETRSAERAPAGCRVVVLSFLFNWPSTGGGIVHTFELVQFLARAGYDVHHVYVRFPPWGIGTVTAPLPFANTALAFAPGDWNRTTIQARVQAAVGAQAPDYVSITDSWNFKPWLAQAVRNYPYLLRLQANECLCPLNNVRLLRGADGRARQCPRYQLARPDCCQQCLATQGHCSGALHRAERELSEVGTAAYDVVLRQAFAHAEATLVVNPFTATMVEPYTEHVVVSPAGMDPARFPWPWTNEPRELRTPGRLMIFFAGLVEEAIKGYHVLHEACRRLWQVRQDFELVATGDPPGSVDAFTRYVGWLPQGALPRHLRAADGATGLLCEPDNPEDLAAKLAILLDDAELRARLGQAGRKRFDERCRWDVTIERDCRATKPVSSSSIST